MKRMRPLLALVLFCTLSLSSNLSANDALKQRVKDSRESIQSFARALLGNLNNVMQKNGPVAAVEACNTIAPLISLTKSKSYGWKISRTSLKLRNPDNAPDAWERAVLEQFEMRKAKGESMKELEYYEIVEMEGRQMFRYMKAIPMLEKPCLSCHGSNISPDIKTALDAHYPHDRARDFKVGDIRGAFTILQPM